MAKIYTKLQALIDSKAVMPFTSEGAVDMIPRRKLINWNVREKDGSYRVARETVERMNRRADAGLGFDAESMKKVARGQRVKGEAAKIAAQDSAIASGAVVVKPKAKNSTPPVAATPTPAPTPAATVPASSKLGGEDTNVILVFDESGSMRTSEREINAQAEAIRQRLKTELPKARVDVLCFGTHQEWLPSVSAAEHMPALVLRSHRGGTSLYTATATVAQRAIEAKTPTLIYLVTDGDATDGGYGWGGNPANITKASGAVAAALATNRITFACVGPAAASTFFRNCGIPDSCVRKWDGVDKTDLNKVTAQAAQGVSNYAQARSAGKTKMDSFFVDVVANAITPERVKKELRDITSSLRVRKISKFEVMKDYVEKELKLTLVPGAGYYPLQKAEVLKQGRRIIVQVRGESHYYAGPAARKLLGLPEDRDVKVEPKNLGELVVYFQSASPTRKLLPGTQFLYDESHVPGATAPTWSYADNAKKGA